MSSPGQALLKRNATYTREQFSAHWLKHGAKVTPWALENGVTYYAQVCMAALPCEGRRISYNSNAIRCSLVPLLRFLVTVVENIW